MKNPGFIEFRIFLCVAYLFRIKEFVIFLPFLLWEL